MDFFKDSDVLWSGNLFVNCFNWDPNLSLTESMHYQHALKDAQVASSLAGSRGTFRLEV